VIIRIGVVIKEEPPSNDMEKYDSSKNSDEGRNLISFKTKMLTEGFLRRF